MRGVVLNVKGTDDYLRYEHSDVPKISPVVLEKATLFWPDELEEGFEEELITLTKIYYNGFDIRVVEVEVSIEKSVG
jgi:hypothetical protein